MTCMATSASGALIGMPKIFIPVLQRKIPTSPAQRDCEWFEGVDGMSLVTTAVPEAEMRSLLRFKATLRVFALCSHPCRHLEDGHSALAPAECASTRKKQKRLFRLRKNGLVLEVAHDG